MLLSQRLQSSVKHLKTIMAYNFLYFLVKFLSYLPFGVLYAFSDCMYYLVYYVFRYRRKLVRKNIVECFPEKTEKECIRIEKGFYSHFADQIVESVKLASISSEELRQRMKFTNAELVNGQNRNGKSVALFLGHYANWEWVSSLPLWLEKNVTGAQIYHKLRNESMDRLMLYIRGRMGAANVDMYKTVRYINEQVNAGKTCFIGFIADQSPQKRYVTHFLKFLNHNTPVLVGTEKVTKKYGFEPFFLYVRKVKRGYYEADFIQMHNNSKSLPDFELTAIYYQLLEKMIRECPELYLWTHNRFKHAKN